jgi:hypothetical protein
MQVREAIASLFRTTLPPEKHFLIPGLTDVVAAGPDVVGHLGKQWNDLSEPSPGTPRQP